jgi:hypothetical protein
MQHAKELWETSNHSNRKSGNGEGNIKKNLKQKAYETVVWSQMVQESVLVSFMNKVLNLQFP